ncbi:MAG: lysophospholipid acyltransferase family protein [Burkholderiaceae bacterium]
MTLQGWRRLSWRLPALAVLVLLGLVWAVAFMPWLGRAMRALAMKTFAHGLLAICGVRLYRTGQPTGWPNPCLLVSNHISWIDIYVVLAQAPVVFIAKSEIRSWPVIGWLVRLSGTIFIERGSRHALRGVLHQAAARFKSGHAVLFFPEGTTSDGLGLLPFHSNLFSLAQQDLDLPICALTIRYGQHGQASTVPAYIGEMTLLQSMVAILTTPGLSAHCHVHPSFYARDFEGPVKQLRGPLSDHARGLIASVTGPTVDGHLLKDGPVV